MNVVYVAYRSWAFDILKGLLQERNSSYTITGLLTLKDTYEDVRQLDISSYIIDPKNLESESIKKILSKLKPDVFLFYGWSWIIPASLYTKYPCLILHTSPLPKYRGGSPLQNQIIRGETESAISILKANEGIDEGPIYAQAPFSLEGTMDEIFTNIVNVGLVETKKVLHGISTKTLAPTPQDQSKQTYFKRRKPNESELTLNDFENKSAKELYDFIRALGDPYPNAYVICKDGKKLYFTGAKIDKVE